jgi:hypothetical protein
MPHEVEHYLRVHFAPQTACIDLKLTQGQAEALVQAMTKHAGDVMLKVGTTHNITTKMIGA